MHVRRRLVSCRWLAAMAVTVLIAHAPGAHGQKAIAGTTHLVEGKDSPRPYAPSAQPGGIVSAVEISHAGASFMKVLVEDFELAPGDHIIVRNTDSTEVHQYDASSPARFWTLSIFGDTVIVELVSRSGIGGRGFRVQGYAAGAASLPCDLIEPDVEACPLTCSDCGAGPCMDCCGCPDDCTLLDCDASTGCCGLDYACISPSAAQKRMARTVCAIYSPADPPGDIDVCSGYQIAHDATNGWILTAAHCIPDSGDWSDAEIWFNVERTDCTSETMKTISKYSAEWICGEDQMINFDCNAPTTWGLDYALLRTTPLSGARPAQYWGKARLSNDPPVVPSKIERFHHSYGCQKQYRKGGITTDFNCLSCGVLPDVRYLYTACGGRGSSGSPVFDVNHCVVLHHVFAGINNPPSCTTPGGGVRMDLIVDDMIAKACLPPGVLLCGVPGTGTQPVIDPLAREDLVRAILGAWGPCDGCPEDWNYDGTVDSDDLAAALGAQP